MTTTDPEKARDILKAVFPFTEKTTQKMAVYRNPRGREIAVQRERSESFYAWLEKYDIALPGIAVKNEKFPSQPYDRKQRVGWVSGAHRLIEMNRKALARRVTQHDRASADTPHVGLRRDRLLAIDQSSSRA